MSWGSDLEPLQCRQGGPAGACHVEVGDELEGDGLGLFLAKGRVLADLCQEPLAEFRGGLNDTAADEVAARVDESCSRW